MTKRARAAYSLGFCLEVTQQIVDEGRTIKEVAESLRLGKSTVYKWSRQLLEERNGKLSSATPLSQIKLRYKG